MTSAHEQACAMLETFASVGAITFDLTLTTRNGEKVRFRKGVALDDLRRMMPHLLDGSASLERNVILRPRAAAGTTQLMQLDDLDSAGIERVKPAAFLILETSAGNYQAWVAVPAGAGDDFARRLRKGTGADDTASGATRAAGSLNFKEKYAPNFPRVQIRYNAPGLTATKEKLAELGLIGQASPVPSARRRSVTAAARDWPSYARCLERAPAAHDGSHPDISRADFTWCMIAIDWGWNIEETAARLMEESTKARDNGERYALLTAQRAAAAVRRRAI